MGLLFTLGATFHVPFPCRFNATCNALDRCYKRRFISYPILINDPLNEQDCKIFKKTLSVDSHPLCPYIPSKKDCSYHLSKH